MKTITLFFSYWKIRFFAWLYGKHATLLLLFAFMCVTQNALASSLTEKLDVSNYTDKEYSVTTTWTSFVTTGEFFDFAPTGNQNLNGWVEWTVEVGAGGYHLVNISGYYENGHGWRLQLIQGGVVRADYYTDTNPKFGFNQTTYSKEPWDLRGIDAGTYTLRVWNTVPNSRAKLRDITISKTLLCNFIKDCKSKPYPGGAIGVIDEPLIETFSGFTTPMSFTKLSDKRVRVSIGSGSYRVAEASDYAVGSLKNVPTASGVIGSIDCEWRFDSWQELPSGAIATDTIIRAYYFPTFNIQYDTDGGTINETDYAQWYEYTGKKEDETRLPVDVTKAGYQFAGWYSEDTPYDKIQGNIACNFEGTKRFIARWEIPCEEPLSLVKCNLVSHYVVQKTGYNNLEYAGIQWLKLTENTAMAEVDPDHEGQETGWQLGEKNNHFFVEVKDGDFRIGDRVRVAITGVNTNCVVDGSTDILTIYSSVENFPGTYDGGVFKGKRPLVTLKGVNQPGVYEYILTAADVIELRKRGDRGLGVFREEVNGQNPYVYSVEILGCRDLVFDDNNGTGVWSDPLNWYPDYNAIPGPGQSARIIRPCTVDINNAVATNLNLCKENGMTGRLTINPDAALTLSGMIREVKGENYSTSVVASASDILIRSNASHQGALAQCDTTGKTRATVQFYARGNGAVADDPNAVNTATWQYVGTPFSDRKMAEQDYYGSWMCRWKEDQAGDAGTYWHWVGTHDPIEPFVGYALTQKEAKLFTWQGTLQPPSVETLNLTTTDGNWAGFNLFANSWMAPIQIANFEDENFSGPVHKTIFLFNTGISDGETEAKWESVAPAGQYSAVPIHTASSMPEELQTIAPMQGFYIYTPDAATVTMPYGQLVFNDTHTMATLPNRAPRRGAGDLSKMPGLTIMVEGTHYGDVVFLYLNSEQTHGYDDGWDGLFIEGKSEAPQLMTRNGDLDLTVDVSPSLNGKRLAFRAGEDTEYTLVFETQLQGLRLLDLVTNRETDITDGGRYTFTADNRDEAMERFEIREVGDWNPPTQVEQLSENATMQEVLRSPALRSLQLFTADGKHLLTRTSSFSRPLPLTETGVYILRLQTDDKTYTFKLIK